MTGSEWLAYVKRTFIRTDKDTEIYESTNDAIQMLINSYPFEDYKTIKTDSSIASGNSFDLPTDFMRLLTEISCIDSSSGLAAKLEHISAAQFERLYANYYADTTQTGIPAHFCIVGKTVYVGPAPDSFDYAYRYIYEFYQSTAIAAGTTTVPFTTVNRKMLKHLVLGALYQDLEKTDLASHHMTIGSGMLNDIIGVESANVDGVMTVEYQDI